MLRALLNDECRGQDTDEPCTFFIGLVGKANITGSRRAANLSSRRNDKEALPAKQRWQSPSRVKRPGLTQTCL
jgi:hypothetical protein